MSADQTPDPTCAACGHTASEHAYYGCISCLRSTGDVCQSEADVLRAALATRDAADEEFESSLRNWLVPVIPIADLPDNLIELAQEVAGFVVRQRDELAALRASAAGSEFKMRVAEFVLSGGEVRPSRTSSAKVVAISADGMHDGLAFSPVDALREVFDNIDAARSASPPPAEAP